MQAALFLAALLAVVSSRPEYSARIPNGDNVPGYYSLGHRDDSGGPRNAFGNAYGSAGKWTVALCQQDSDGDGQTNGQELGDPCCIWTKGTAPNQTTGLSHPGLASSMRDPVLFSKINCTGLTMSQTSTATWPLVAAWSCVISIWSCL
ncbi:unnamed protein product [Aphanomyces euteiches]|uniref:Temptin Cys/Cys disulfide domain-containing protein n=1 Tax=Aphanomyces euteiches TaxID=100861 RepID=A0A6G0XNN0_9STRA|nr:hypothetical protein Ae201684_003022 [Aphanomyces euteiches]KAH9085220.1 hypothetical protein LEN26_020528 [Aphanomyces euteiches]KAH9098711.1 hypothetical protein Ae201684P_017922 [Aphanomyces euteiches]KAH9129079.1 hypothetical protein AeMF1_000854 [Aphanomyces euteiches]KAH9134923.1 hypothetical protein AeRB84_019428 [Aphanomyces euteiches]